MQAEDAVHPSFNPDNLAAVFTCATLNPGQLQSRIVLQSLYYAKSSALSPLSLLSSYIFFVINSVGRSRHAHFLPRAFRDDRPQNYAKSSVAGSRARTRTRKYICPA